MVLRIKHVASATVALRVGVLPRWAKMIICKNGVTAMTNVLHTIAMRKDKAWVTILMDLVYFLSNIIM